MKELSIEEKAKAYDEAIKRVEDIVGGKCPKPFVFTEGLFDYIFPELKESEDERIMKALYKMAKVPRKEIYEAEGITKEQALAWLEKQGKQKETLCDKCKKTQPSHSCQDITALGRCALEKQGEQKPQGKSALEAINEEKIDNANKVEPKQEKLTEFEKAVKQVMEEAIECGDTRNLKADAEMLLSLVHKSAWSEEDEKILSDIVKDLVHPWNEYIPDRVEDEIKWLKNRLKSLKNRVQPKQEWSEEDKKIIDRIESEFLALHRGDYKNIDFNDVDSLSVLNWVRKIKSLSFQSRWKPSDEQIKAVKEAACYSSVFSEKTIDNLISLSKDLNKLKG